jgi:hypothetical protein
MAKEDTQFKPGQSGNPNGRPQLSADERRIRKLTNDEIKEVGSLLLAGKESELAALVASDETPILKKWMANVALIGLKSGDERRMTALLDRIVGKVKEEIDINVRPRPVIIERHDGTAIEMTARDVKEIEE